MAESFYGGKAGFGFILRPNTLREDGKWTSLGNSESPDQNSIYGGVARGDVRAGEYAIVDSVGQSDFYRISNQLEPILISSIEKIKGPDGDPGRTAKWFAGTEITGVYPTIIEIPTSNVGDMYLNSETGNVYKKIGAEGTWSLLINIKGPTGDFNEFTIYNGNDSVPLKVQKIKWVPYNSGDSIYTTASVKNDIRILACTPDEDKALIDYHPAEANLPVNQRKKIKWKITVNNNDEKQWVTDQIEGKFTLGDASNNTYLTQSVWYDASHMADDPNILHIYPGGGLLPPALAISGNITVWLGNQNTQNFTNAQRLSSGLYMILPQGLVRIGAHTDWIGLSYNLNANDTLSNCSIRFFAVNPFWNTSIPTGEEEIETIEKNWNNPITVGPSSNSWGDAYKTYCLNDADEHEGETIAKKTVGSSNQIFNNCWDFIQAITQNGESVLSLQIS